MKRQLVESNTRRVEAIERGEQTVVGVNGFIETEASPLAGAAETVLTVSPRAQAEQIARLAQWRAARDANAVAAALKELRAAAQENRNIMPPSIACAKAGVTTGEWGFALRENFGIPQTSSRGFTGALCSGKSARDSRSSAGAEADLSRYTLLGRIA